MEMLSKTPAVASAAGELALYVDRMPSPTATPTGVVDAKNAASPRYGPLRSRQQGFTQLSDVTALQALATRVFRFPLALPLPIGR